LAHEERQQVLDTLHGERFVDQPPHQVYATLLDEGVYLCSVRTMYRVLASEGEVRERRDQARHPAYARPELLATRSNELWSWDITVVPLRAFRFPRIIAARGIRNGDAAGNGQNATY
jgi:putative transposase